MNTVKCRMVKYDTSRKEPPYKSVRVGEFEIYDSNETNDLGEARYSLLSEQCERLNRTMQFYTLSEVKGYKYDVYVLLTLEEWPHCSLGKFNCHCLDEKDV